MAEADMKEDDLVENDIAEVGCNQFFCALKGNYHWIFWEFRDCLF